MPDHLLLTRGERRKLPDLRKGHTQKIVIEHPDNKLYIRTGEFADGTLGEVFLDMHKQGAQLQAFVHCFAMATSIGLQYGVPLEEFITLFAGYSFSPNGPVTGHDHIRQTTSMLDAVFRHLGIWYLEQHDLAEPQERKKSSDILERARLSSKRSERSILPHRRTTIRQKLMIGGHKLYIETGHYDTGDKATVGPVGEIFITMHKEGDDLRAMMNAFAMAVSLGLQYGVPLEEYIESFVGTKFEPSGKVTGHKHVRYAMSSLDCIFRVVGYDFLDREDLVLGKVVDEPDEEAAETQ